MERAVPQGAGHREQGPATVIHTGLEGARLQSTALWADSGQGCAIRGQGEPLHRGWAGSRDPQVMGTAAVCGQGCTRLPAGHTAQLHREPEQGRRSAGTAQFGSKGFVGAGAARVRISPSYFSDACSGARRAPKLGLFSEEWL